MELDKNTSALLVIDAIEAVGDDSLYDPDAATAAYRAAVARSVAACHAAGIPVIYCNDAHVRGYDRELALWGEHGIAGETRIFPEIAREPGDIVVITAGVPLGVNGTTNLLKVHVVGDILVTGQGVNKRSAFGRLCVARTEEEALKNFNDGDILVIPQTSNALLPILKKASGIVTERGGLNSHAAIVGMALDIPVIVFAENATAILKSSSVVEVDASAGTVSNRTRTE